MTKTTKITLALWAGIAACVLLVVTIETTTPRVPQSASAAPAKMAKYLLRRYFERELGADPDVFEIYGAAERTGPKSWLVSGSYRPPIGDGSLKWEMHVYGPYDGDKWRNCELRINDEIATRVGTSVPCY